MVEGALAVGLQRIDVEETVTGKVHARQHIIIECHLRYIDILGIARHKEHTVVENHITYRCTRLIVGLHVGQHIRRTELLQTCHSTQAARDVHLLINYIVPDSIQRRGQRLIARHSRHIGHARVEIHSTHRVTHSLTLLAYGLMLLRIVRGLHTLAIGRVGHTTNVDKLLCHIEIQLLARGLIQLHQRQLNLLVTRGLHNGFAIVVGRVALEEDFIYMAGVLLRHVQPLALARSTVVCHSTFVHMTHVVQLVAVIDVRIWSFARTVARITQVRGHNMMLIKITIRGLRCGNDVDNLIHLTLQRLILLQREQICRTLHNLKEVGCNIVGALQLFGHTLPTQICAHTAEVLHGIRGLLQREWHKCFLLCFEAWKPETIIQRHLLKRDLCNSTLVWGYIGRGRLRARHQGCSQCRSSD